MFLALFLHFSGCLKFFLLVSNDSKEAVVPGREVLWATVGLAEGFLREGFAGGDSPSGGWRVL